MSDKFCVDCKNHLLLDGYVSQHRCIRPGRENIDLVTGKALGADCYYERHLSSSLTRNDMCGDEGTCGIEGHYWEPKQQEDGE